MFDLVIIIAILPLVINPKKVTENPACKIKNPAVIRGLGIIVIIVLILANLARFLV